MEDNQPPLRRRGRPLSFDRQHALHQAMLLFWRHGYEGTSLSELTVAMGITPPSLYAAFGDKKTLFLEAVSYYLAGPMTPERIIAAAPTARDAAAGLLHAAVIGFTGKSLPRGCLLAHGAISCSASAADVEHALATLRSGIETLLRLRIETAIKIDEVPATTNAGVLAGYVMTIIQGMSTLARDGATRRKLRLVADLALQNWPPGKKAPGARTEKRGGLRAIRVI